MKAIKKINNNVALCVDSNSKELIAFGKGIGFPPMPYDVDLNIISMTFYRIESKFYELINELPEEILEVSAIIVNEAFSKIGSNLNPNLVVSLADHINFAIIRMKKYKNMKMLFSFEMEQLYPKETALGKFALRLIQKKLFITLPDSEITSIAMHFVNAEEETVSEIGEVDFEEFISDVLGKIEKAFSVSINKGGFNCNRFTMHLRYYLKRVQDKTQYNDDNVAVTLILKEAHPDIYKCAVEIGDFIGQRFNVENTEDEILYLMLHISRMVQNTIL